MVELDYPTFGLLIALPMVFFIMSLWAARTMHRRIAEIEASFAEYRQWAFEDDIEAGNRFHALQQRYLELLKVSVEYESEVALLKARLEKKGVIDAE